LDHAARAAKAALRTLAQEETRLQPSDILYDFARQQLLADRARSQAILGNWAEALRIIDTMLVESRDFLTWVPARIYCLRKLGREGEEAQAMSEYRAYYEDIGLDVPKGFPQWP
jgi:hypothetical protein